MKNHSLEKNYPDKCSVAIVIHLCCRAYVLLVVKNVPIDVSAHAQ